jgi:ABC-type Co2+ transport system permease subunit
MADSTASVIESTMAFMEGAVGVVIVLYLAEIRRDLL